MWLFSCQFVTRIMKRTEFLNWDVMVYGVDVLQRGKCKTEALVQSCEPKMSSQLTLKWVGKSNIRWQGPLSVRKCQTQTLRQRRRHMVRFTFEVSFPAWWRITSRLLWQTRQMRNEIWWVSLAVMWEKLIWNRFWHILIIESPAALGTD